MLRYIIGLSLVAVFTMIIRKKFDGKILKKHQYALWLLIPVFMIMCPLMKIDIPVSEIFTTEQTELVDKTNTDIVVTDPVQPDKQDQTVYPEAVQDQNVAVSAEKTEAPLNIAGLVRIISLSVSALLIFAFTVYNIGFIVYCIRKRNFIRKDSISRLKVYSIGYKGAPFLLFNKIYVNDEADADNKYIIYHEAAHHKHGDTFWCILRYLVLALNWYNPFIWAAFILSGIDCELACDEEAISYFLGKDYSADYAMALYEKLKQQSEVAFGFTVSSGLRSEFKTMKRRIAGIKSPAKKSYRSLALCIVVSLVFSVCILIDPARTVSVADSASTSTVDYPDTVFDVPLSEAKIRLADSSIAPSVFDADENTVKELAKAFRLNPITIEMKMPRGYVIEINTHKSELEIWTNDFFGKGVYMFVNYKGKNYKLFFSDNGYVEYWPEGVSESSSDKYFDSGVGSAVRECAKRKDNSIDQDRMIMIPPWDFTPEGVWKYDPSFTVVRGFKNYLSSWPEGVWGK